MPLRQRCAVGADQQSHMPVPRATQAQRIQHHELARRIGQMIVAAQHLRDAHQRVVDGIAKKRTTKYRRPCG